jgi:hypothetical protein
VFGRGVLIEQNDDTVIVALVEKRGSMPDAVSRGSAFILVHSHFMILYSDFFSRWV